MKKSFVAVAGLLLAVATSGSSHAQMMSAWNGPYAGVNVGGGWIRDEGNDFCVNPAGVLNGAGCDSVPHSHLAPGGFFGGLQGGYNWQFPNLVVLGLEADLQGSSISDNVNGLTIAGSQFYASERMPWFGTVRPRIGYAGFAPFGSPLMVYATGGLMFGHLDISENVVGGAGVGQFPAHKDTTRLGWIAGPGIEAMVSPTLSLKLEAAYFDLGSETVSSFSTAGNGFQGGKKFTNEGGLIRIGVNYHFGAPPPPPPPVAAPPAPPPAAVAPSKQMFIVFFEFDKSSLTPDGRKVVDAAATAFKAGKSSVAIAGYTDLAGTAQYNMALSKRRADTVKGALVRDGVPAAAIDESWHGKENPRVPTADGVREPQNRRVEITM